MKTGIAAKFIRTGMRVLALASVLSISAICASASTLWNLDGVSFSDGDTAVGFFTYDVGSNTVTDWNIVVSGGVFSYDFTPGTSSVPGSGTMMVLFDDLAAPPDSLFLLTSAPMSDTGGVQTINLVRGTSDCYNGGVTCGQLVTGAITNVPEPSSMLMLAGGALILGLAFYRMRRSPEQPLAASPR
jgi:hypothetical protein